MFLMNAKIIVASHKAYRMPSDPLYLPLQVGAALHDPLPYSGESDVQKYDITDLTNQPNPWQGTMRFAPHGSIEEFLIDAAGRGHGISLGQVWFINTAEYDIDADILVLRPQNMKY